MSDPNEAAQDAAWREIVENFGERAELADQPAVEDAVVPFGDDVDESFTPDVYDDAYDIDEHDRFVAPRPTLPRTTPERFLAWLGLLGAPIGAVLLFIAHVSLHWWIPNWVVAGLALAFLAGFGYLVFAMPREPRDPWDDGARL
ncbi:MAG: hypothetical protein ACXVWW_09230 [Nocardioides sp.]